MAIVIKNNHLSYGLGRTAMVNFHGKTVIPPPRSKKTAYDATGKIALWGDDNRTLRTL